ncbi:hypothetical protein ETA_28200 [Erwinia tasmaniensis Et1/99]|uniref:Uncharacterized protein n=1 Tax=Erwinia tasmaniensis (strain DSM 17950 / CFBP 7177 / CIP 109463 / NCPPB 4357 / Et1/99) TaxID=465817 RepID=B2VF29_ERWT9|nr:hypothetical protein ETA_28200 [Erwinia tasmaniensis Et1/99]
MPSGREGYQQLQHHPRFFVFYCIGIFFVCLCRRDFFCDESRDADIHSKIENFFPARHKWSISTGKNIINSGDKGTSPADANRLPEYCSK